MYNSNKIKLSCLDYIYRYIECKINNKDNISRILLSNNKNILLNKKYLLKNITIIYSTNINYIKYNSNKIKGFKSLLNYIYNLIDNINNYSILIDYLIKIEFLKYQIINNKNINSDNILNFNNIKTIK